MKCIILAAGYATRLYPLTENFPKPLLEVGNKPILDWLIDDICSTTDIREFIVISNHRFTEHFNKWAYKKNTEMRGIEGNSTFKITVIDDGTETNESRLGAVRDIEFALNETGIDDDVLVMAGDNLLDFSLSEFVSFAEDKGSSCVMCHEENDIKKQRKTAIITFDKDKLITGYEEKPQNPKGHHAVPPFYIYTAKDITRVSEALRDGCNADAPGSFAAWLSGKTGMYAYEMPGKRYDIGDVKSYEDVKRRFEG